MRMLTRPELEPLETCPYLAGRQKRYEFFLAVEVGAGELSALLRSGWRKFGPYFFRPACPDCRSCIPLRVPVADFAPSRSQRRVLRRNADLEVRFGPLRYSEELFRIYRNHSALRFGQSVDIEEFASAFFLPSCPGLQSELLLAGEPIGVGFLDCAADALSSVYFSFEPLHAGRSPGTFSVLEEIELAKRLGLAYYYLGYYVPGCPRMAYKDQFRPRQHFHWQTRTWQRAEEPPGLPPAVAE